MGKNGIIAILLAAVVLLGWNFFVTKHRPPVQPTQTTQQTTMPQKPLPKVKSSPLISEKVALKKSAHLRVPFRGESVEGSILTRGLVLDDLKLKQYRVHPKSSKRVPLLAPMGTEKGASVAVGWIGSNTQTPGDQTTWNVLQKGKDGGTTFTWKNARGVRFREHYTVDEHYMVTVQQVVHNTSKRPIVITPYGHVLQRGTHLSKQHYYYVHEGPLMTEGGGNVEELKYENAAGSGYRSDEPKGGWAAFGGKYWLKAIVPPQTTPVSFQLRTTGARPVAVFTQTATLPTQKLAPGKSSTVVWRFYLGAKRISLLHRYGKEYNIPNFIHAIDFGWLFFLTEPLFWLLTFFTKWFGSVGFAILLLTVFIRLLLFPLARKSYLSVARMRRVQPKLQALRKRYADDKGGLARAMAQLYKEEKVQPAQGCIVALIQVPIFFSLYKVFLNTIDLRQARFLFIPDLSQPEHHGILQLFGLLNYHVPQNLLWLNIGLGPIILGITIFLQQKVTMVSTTDPMQRRIFAILPVVFVFVFRSFPMGLVVYWIFNNVLSMLQQIYFMKRLHVPLLETTTEGGSK